MKVIKTKKAILWVFSGLAFILSAIIDNLTATIVLISILQKVVSDKNLRIWYAALIVIAANAGGAWSPIGDVTTTMLWIGNKVTTKSLIGYVLIPSLVCLIIPVFIASFMKPFKGYINDEDNNDSTLHPKGSVMLYLGLSAIVFVPVFKTLKPTLMGFALSSSIKFDK